MLEKHGKNPAVSRFLILAVFAIIAVVTVSSHTPLGAALSMDSLSYLAAAENILQGNGIATDTYDLSGPGFEPTTYWPPLYPVLLAGITWLAGLTDISVVTAIAVFNIAALFFSLYLMMKAASISVAPAVGAVVAVALALSPSVQIVFLYAWSEVIFLPLTLAAYVRLQSYLSAQGEPRKLDLLLVVVLLALATWARYVGLAFFAGTALALLVYARGSWTERIRTVTLASLAYLVLLAPVLFRNVILVGSLAGKDRGVPSADLISDLSTLTWLLYLEFINQPVLPVVILGVACIAVLTWFSLKRPRGDQSGDASFWQSTVGVPLLLAGCYLVFLLVARSRQVIDLDSRMLSVALPFLMLGLVGTYLPLSARLGKSLTLIPFLLPAGAFAVNALNTHTGILAGWREQGEPGRVLGINYRSMTGRQLDSLRAIKERFPLGSGDLLLTDITRPVIVQHLFPDTDVRQLTADANDQSLAALDGLLQQQGLMVVGGTDWWQVLGNELEGRADFYSFQAQAGRPEWIVIDLPIRTP